MKAYAGFLLPAGFLINSNTVLIGLEFLFASLYLEVDILER